MIFKIIEYREDDNDYIATDESGKQVIIDPFVSCVFNYADSRKHIGKIYEDDGKSSEPYKNVFIPHVLNCIEC